MERPALLAIDTSAEFCSVAVCLPYRSFDRSSGVSSSVLSDRSPLPHVLAARASGRGQAAVSDVDDVRPDPTVFDDVRPNAMVFDDAQRQTMVFDDAHAGLRFFISERRTGAVSSAFVLPDIAATLRAAQVDLRDCGVLAFGAGPGAFTGLRTATGIAQGVAFGAGMRVSPVSTLLACAVSAWQRGTIDAPGGDGLTTRTPSPSDSRVLVAIDARMDECYWQAFEWSDDTAAFVPLHRAQVGPPDTVATPWPDDGLSYTALGNGWRRYHGRFARASYPARVDDQARPTAAAIAAIAWRTVDQALPPAQALPVYVRDKVASTIAEREVERQARQAKASVASAASGAVRGGLAL